MQLDIFTINKRHQINSHHIIELILKQSPSLLECTRSFPADVLNNQWCDHRSKARGHTQYCGITMKSLHKAKTLNMYELTHRTDGWADTRSDDWLFKKCKIMSSSVSLSSLL